MLEEERFAYPSTPMQTVDEHGNFIVTVIMGKLACMINIISGVSYPGFGSSTYGQGHTV